MCQTADDVARQLIKEAEERVRELTAQVEGATQDLMSVRLRTAAALLRNHVQRLADAGCVFNAEPPPGCKCTSCTSKAVLRAVREVVQREGSSWKS
jgi:hypothetical protein